jgi:hypothetical protein
MKHLPLLLTLALTAVASRADLIVEQKVEGPMPPGNIVIKVKGDNLRIDMPSGPMGAMTMLMNVNTGDSVNLIHGQKMAMSISGAQTKAMMEMMKKQAPGGAEAAAPKLQATGKKEKVGEYDAEIYTWSGGGANQTLWVVKDYPGFDKFKDELTKLNKAAASGFAQGAQPDFSTLPGMVVKTVAESAGTKLTSTLVSVKQEPLDAALFEAPKDYQSMAQPTLPGAAPQAPK